MDDRKNLTKKTYLILGAILISAFASNVIAVDSEEKLRRQEKLKQKKEAAAEAKRQSTPQAGTTSSELLDKLPEDKSERLTAKELRIRGNTLIPTEELLLGIPAVFNASDVPAEEVESGSLYLFDLRPIQSLVNEPGEPREVSARTIQGFTQYLLSVYQKQNYAGIYVRVPPDAIKEGKLKEDILSIEVVEIPVGDVRSTLQDVEHNVKEEGFLRKGLIEEWSPAKSGQVANKKELDDFVNLLNLNPDRYVSTRVSEGTEPGSLAVGYDVYEVEPWHYFFQIDNAGTDDRKWSPRLGLINTNFTGRDDKLTVMAQVAPGKRSVGRMVDHAKDNYSVYGSYDFPLWTPRLRLTLFGGYSEYEVDGGAGIDFLGHGSFYGGELRFTALQHDGWFFDVTSSLSQEKSKVTTSLFPQFLGSEVTMNLWGVGFDIHRRSDMSNTSFVFDRIQSIGGGSGQSDYWDSATSTGARTNASRDFAIYTTAVYHSQYLDNDKIQRLTGSFRWIIPDERLIPAKMTTFGGMYSVRGYKESRIVADGGILASLQYEYDLVKHGGVAETEEAQEERKPWLKKLAPLVFFDYGRAKTKNPVPGEKKVEELHSLGLGMIIEIGENFNGAIYYGWPLRATDDTKRGDGRLNIGLTMRW